MRGMVVGPLNDIAGAAVASAVLTADCAMLRSIWNAEATGPIISGASNREMIAGPLMGMGQLPVPSSRVELFHAIPTNTTTPRYSEGLRLSRPRPSGSGRRLPRAEPFIRSAGALAVGCTISNARRRRERIEAPTRARDAEVSRAHGLGE